ncbi:MAG: 2OG-Fe(II) oxygenase [Lysobacterales bacterium]
MLSAELLSQLPALGADFRQAQPFRHVVIEPFFEPAVAERLLDQFPAFERGDARSENGTLGGKSCYPMIAGLGGIYRELDRNIQSPEFLAQLSQLTGIEELRYDPDYFGGGTHENRRGQELDPHVDFNRHPGYGWYRRLNLIIYLNNEWSPEWGGGLQLHRDPRSPQDEIITVEPRFNRAILFETHDHSWHGFPLIRTPDERPELSRKSIALYFYTEQPPGSHRGPDHSTIYVDRPLPSYFQPGRQLDEADCAELARHIARRDQHLQRIYGDVARVTTELNEARQALAASRVERLARIVHRGLRRLGWTARS